MAESFKKIALDLQDIQYLRMADRVLLQSLFVSGHRPRSKITIQPNPAAVPTPASHPIVVAGGDIRFLAPRLKENRVECHCVLFDCMYNYSWQTMAAALRPGDELELVWNPDSHTSPNMLDAGCHGDSLVVVIHSDAGMAHYAMAVFVTDPSDPRPIRLTVPITHAELRRQT